KVGKIYKSYSAGENAFVDIFELPNGKWVGEGTSVFQANQDNAGFSSSERTPGARFVMRVCKGDLIALDHNGARTIMVVRRLAPAHNRFLLAAHNETGNLDERNKDSADPFHWLQATYNVLRTMKAERVRVDELGRPWRIPPEEAARALQ
ncbi:MAG: hypothetical protein JO256_04985, partial [Alphaproteobacteria bacterium]|nr:hypothetical protein [Alphaproteobacteria bacterium]